MKLDEIQKVPQQPFNLDGFDFSDAEQITTAENIPLYYIKRSDPKDPTLECYALQINEQFVSFLFGKTSSIDDSPVFFVLRTYTLPKYRNQGLMTALYVALKTKLKLSLVSDNEMSPETISIWKKLTKTLPVKIINTDTKTISDYDDNVFDDNNPSTRLIIEASKLPHPDIRIPERPLLGDGLGDYVVYTHPENNRKYE